MELLEVDAVLRRTTTLESRCCVFKQLRLPLRDVIGMNVEAFCELRDRHVASDGGDCHLRLKRRRVVPARPSCQDLLLSKASSPPGEQSHHLSGCSVTRGHLSTAIRRALTVQEVRRLLDVVKDDRYEAVYVLAVTAGMRIGEILALRWEDVDFDAGTIAIRRTIVEKGGKFMLGPPKTTKSFRTIYIPQIALNALRKRFSGQEGYVFPSRSGRPVLRTRFTNSEWSRVRKAAGLDGVVFHQLRHTAATLQLRAGTHPVVVQELLGHSSVSITLDVYSHATADLHRQSADRIDKMLEWPRYATNHATN
jgi:hypothetical protein